jgi:hypothetical protein
MSSAFPPYPLPPQARLRPRARSRDAGRNGAGLHVAQRELQGLPGREGAPTPAVLGAPRPSRQHWTLRCGRPAPAPGSAGRISRAALRCAVPPRVGSRAGRRADRRPMPSSPPRAPSATPHRSPLVPPFASPSSAAAAADGVPADAPAECVRRHRRRRGGAAERHLLPLLGAGRGAGQHGDAPPAWPHLRRRARLPLHAVHVAHGLGRRYVRTAKGARSRVREGQPRYPSAPAPLC